MLISTLEHLNKVIQINMLQMSKLSYLKTELRDKGYDVTEFWNNLEHISPETYKRFLSLIYSKNDTELEKFANQFGIKK